MTNANNSTILISDLDYQSISLKFQSVDLVLRGLSHMLDEEDHIDQYDIDAVKKVYTELFSEFQELRLNSNSITQEASHD